MPYCSQCGTQVAETDAFCARCGGRQPNAAPPAQPQGKVALENLTPRSASILCYIPWVGWIPAIIVLASDKFRHNRPVRFHAFQGLYLFVAWLINVWVLKPMFRMAPNLHLENLIAVALIFMWIFMIVKASNEEQFSLPVFGELAQRSAAED